MKSSVFWTLTIFLVLSIMGSAAWIFQDELRDHIFSSISVPETQTPESSPIQKAVEEDATEAPVEATSKDPTSELSTQGVKRSRSFVGRLEESQRLMDQGYYSLAALEVAAAMKDKADTIDPYLILGEIYLRTQNLTKLEHLMQTMTHRFPENTAALTLRLRSLVSQKLFTEAIAFIDTVGEAAPMDMYFYEAILRGFQNNHDAAEKLLSTALRSGTLSEDFIDKSQSILDIYTQFEAVSDGKNPHLFALMSQSLSEHHEAVLALEAAELAVKEDIAYPDGWILRGYAKFLLQDYETALTDLRHAYDLDPLRPETHYFLALVLQEMGRSAEASLFFEKSLEHEFAFETDVKWKLVELFMQQKKYDQVVALYQELMAEEGPLKKESIVSMLHSSINIMKKPELALEISQELLDEHPKDIFYLNMQAWAQIANKHFNKASETLQQATYLDDNNPRTLLNLGLLAEEQGYFSRAKEFYKRSYQQGQDQAYESVVNLAALQYNKLIKREQQPENPETPDRPKSSP